MEFQGLIRQCVAYMLQVISENQSSCTTGKDSD